MRLFSSQSGEEFYQRAIHAMKEMEEIVKRKDKEKSEEMYKAWKRAQLAEESSKAQGVTVVKTLVKETRKEINQSDRTEKEALQSQALELLEEAALKHDHPLALVQLGNLALEKAGSKALGNDEVGRRAEVEKAIQLFERAGKNGSRAGWFNLGQVYWTGFPELQLPEELDGDDDNMIDAGPHQLIQILKPDLHMAMGAFVKAIDLGDSDAMYLVGVHRMTEGGKENIYSGLKLVERAGDQGHSGALYYLALLHLNGEPTIRLPPCNDAEFMERLDRAVDAGSVDAMFTRGHSHYHGTEGYPQSYQRAFDDFLRAALEGHAESAVSAGAMLHNGVGVARDHERAFELYQAAGEMGSAEGWKNVVACYAMGEGVPKSLETAKYIADTMLKGEDKPTFPH
jgi:TPR repeat protein